MPGTAGKREQPKIGAVRGADARHPANDTTCPDPRRGHPILTAVLDIVVALLISLASGLALGLIDGHWPLATVLGFMFGLAELVRRGVHNRRSRVPELSDHAPHSGEAASAHVIWVIDRTR